MIPRIRYLEWISPRLETATYDLASSDIRPTHGEEVIESLYELPQPEPDVSLETLIAERYDNSVEEENVLVTAGATTANACAVAMAVADDVHESSTPSPVVLTESPGYEPLSATPRAFGADVQTFRRDPAQDYRVAPQDVAPVLDERVRLVSLSNRHNPSGRTLSREALARIADSVRSSDSYLLVDEVYAPYRPTASRGPGTAFGGPTIAGYESTLVSNSLTKFFGFGGLRIGWLIGEKEAIRRAKAMQWHFLDVAETSREFARIVLYNASDLGEQSREAIRTNASLLSEFVTERSDVTGYLPNGHTMAFLEFDGTSGDEVVSAAWDEGVLLAPGRFFGDSSRVRVSLGRAPDEMKDGLRTLRGVLDRNGK